MLKKARQGKHGGHPTILSRWYGDVECRKSLSAIGWKEHHINVVKTTPQMTRFRDAKVCNNLATDEINDHRIQSDHKCAIGQQNPEGKNSVLGIASAW